MLSWRSGRTKLLLRVPTGDSRLDTWPGLAAACQDAQAVSTRHPCLLRNGNGGKRGLASRGTGIAWRKREQLERKHREKWGHWWAGMGKERWKTGMMKDAWAQVNDLFFWTTKDKKSMQKAWYVCNLLIMALLPTASTLSSLCPLQCFRSTYHGCPAKSASTPCRTTGKTEFCCSPRIRADTTWAALWQQNTVMWQWQDQFPGMYQWVMLRSNFRISGGDLGWNHLPHISELVLLGLCNFITRHVHPSPNKLLSASLLLPMTLNTCARWQKGKADCGLSLSA